MSEQCCNRHAGTNKQHKSLQKILINPFAVLLCGRPDPLKVYKKLRKKKDKKTKKKPQKTSTTKHTGKWETLLPFLHETRQ